MYSMWGDDPVDTREDNWQRLAGDQWSEFLPASRAEVGSFEPFMAETQRALFRVHR